MTAVSAGQGGAGAMGPGISGSGPIVAIAHGGFLSASARRTYEQRAGLTLSAGLHLLVILLFVFWGQGAPDVEAPVIVPERIISARLVAKGTPRPKELLPRIQGRKPAQKEAIHLGKAAPDAQRADRKPEDKEAPEDRSATDILKELAKARVDERADTSPERHGQADGHEDGFDSQGTRTRQEYKDKVLRKLYGSTQYAGIDEAELVKLKATGYLEVDPTGKIRKFEFRHRSGNPRFDAAVERAVQIFSTDGPRALDPHPDEARFGDAYAIEVTWNPQRQR